MLGDTESNLDSIPPRVNFRKVAVIVIVLIGITLTFRVAFEYFFAQDDFVFLGHLAKIHGAGDVIALFMRNDHFYRPMSRVIMLGVPYALFGTAVTGYHLFLLCLHLGNVVMVYHLLRGLGARFSSAVLGMCIYGFYPVHFMPIVWISGIQESSTTFFVLIACLAFIGWRRKPAQVWRYVVTVVAYFAAVLSKEVAVLLPMCLLVVDWLILVPAYRVKMKRRSFGPYLGLVGVTAVFLLIRSVKADAQGQSGPYMISLALNSIWNNFRLYILDMLSLHEGDVGSSFALTWLTVAVFGVLFTVLKSSRRWLIVGAAWFLCFLAPALMLSGRHYSYYFSLSAAGIAIMACGIGEFFASVLAKHLDLRQRWVWDVCLGVLILVWAGYSYSRINSPWFDDQGLWRKSERAYQIVSDFQKQIPQIAPGSDLYVTEAEKGDEAILEGLFNFYMPALGRVTFDTLEPAISLHPSKVTVFRLPPITREQ